ncbi:hypothetical protein Prudu_017216 [Prunus dulcis]|uniref:Uncharacterized protein n=1 Tax=Prunus dulcis TaxID=3755 RepID=A0A4Y1RPG8_PRUDU|nr:hypothetical protein Prudu_017216 [Prunus dulcis]
MCDDMAPKNVDGEEKSKPRAKQYRTHGLVHYQLLEEIFNTTTATGQLRYASNQLPPNSDEELELENNFLNTSVYIDVDLDDDGVNLETDHGKGKRKSVLDMLLVMEAITQIVIQIWKNLKKCTSYANIICMRVAAERFQRSKDTIHRNLSCIGAIDETHVAAWAPAQKQT